MLWEVNKTAIYIILRGIGTINGTAQVLRILRERERERGFVCVCVCVCDFERKRECVCVCVILRERGSVCDFERESLCMCFCVILRERERKCVCVCVWPLLFSMQCDYTILSSVACPTLQYFSTLSHKRREFRKKVTEHKTCAVIFSTTFICNIFHSVKNLARYEQKCVLVCV